MKARCRRAGKPAEILWVTAKAVSMWQNPRCPETAPPRLATGTRGMPTFIRILQMIAIVVGGAAAILGMHACRGALGARIALDYPSRIAGLVMLARVAYSCRGRVGWYN